MTIYTSAAVMLHQNTSTLTFTNIDATPKKSTVECTRDSVPLVMRWYGAYHAGGRYSVTYDGVKIAKDQNGDIVTPEKCTWCGHTVTKDCLSEGAAEQCPRYY